MMESIVHGAQAATLAFWPKVTLLTLVSLPLASVLLLGLAWLLGWQPREAPVARWTQLVCAVQIVCAAALGYWLSAAPTGAMQLFLGHWLSVGSSHFELSLVLDWLSWGLVQLTTILLGTVAVFSARYMHREAGYFRFFLLMNLFGAGALFVFLAGSFDLLVAGWEMVGLTSVLLISFFQERSEPVRSALHVFTVYRLSGIGLLLAIFLIHSELGTSILGELFTGAWPNQQLAVQQVSGHQLLPFSALVTLIALLLLVAACGKSAQFPFQGWLPRAMEGPTPSSAIFYGAISVHLGAYLLLRIQPWLEASPVASAAVVVVGGLTAFLATLSHRVYPDVKTSLAYAAMTQLGLIFVEIGLGFPRLALAHLAGHAVARTLQFLRAPSMLHDHHRVHAASGGNLGATGAHYHSFVPQAVQLWLYRLGLERGFYDALAERLLVNPVLGLARLLARMAPEEEPGGGAPTSRRPDASAGSSLGRGKERGGEGEFGGRMAGSPEPGYSPTATKGDTATEGIRVTEGSRVPDAASAGKGAQPADESGHAATHHRSATHSAAPPLLHPVPQLNPTSLRRQRLENQL